MASLLARQGWGLVGGLLLSLMGACGGSRSAPDPEPSVATTGADGITAHGAMLHGQAAGNGTSGSASFRFGGDPGLGLTTGRWPYLDLPGVGMGLPVSYPSGGPALDYQAPLTGLVPAWTYSYQAMATTSEGRVSVGQIRSFTTQAASEPTWIRVLLPGGSPALVGLDSGFAVQGGSWGSPTWTVAFDGGGLLRWQRLGAMGNEVLPGARPLASGFLSVFRARTSATPTPSDWHSAVLRVNANGTLVWQRSVSCWLSTGAPTLDGGAVLLGNAGADLATLRLSPSGTVTWAAANDSGQDPLTAFELEGGALVTVGRSVRLPGDHDGIPVEVRAANGALAWRRVLSCGDGERAEAAEPAPGGGLVLAGHTWTGPSQEPLVVRLGGDGSVLWCVRLVGESGAATGLAPTEDGGWILSGAGNGGTADTRYAWVAKLDAAGQFQWAARFLGKFQAPARVLRLPGGRFVVAAQVEVGYAASGVGVIFADGNRRAGGTGTDVALSALPVVLTVEIPVWSDRAVTFPAFSSGNEPLGPTQVTAVQLAP